jgi:aspartate/methionine/tyrosine aminotransferase
VPLSEEDGYHIHPDKISEEIARGTGVILTSNPRNPTGRVVQNPELAEIQDLCRERATFISDEFYSGYNYTSNCDGTTISAAENVIDVDEDDVLIIDGLTKRFRLPGWRVAWILGPKEFIKALVYLPLPILFVISDNEKTASAPAAPTSTAAPTSPSRKQPSPCWSPPSCKKK